LYTGRETCAGTDGHNLHKGVQEEGLTDVELDNVNLEVEERSQKWSTGRFLLSSGCYSADQGGQGEWSYLDWVRIGEDKASAEGVSV